MEAKAKTVAMAVSTVARMGFAVPAVVAVDVNRAAEALPLIAAAVPPPAMIAKDHVTTGLKSVMVATNTKVPANVAKGREIVSNKLSNQGI